MNAYKRLIQKFPPEQQAEVAIALEKLSNDPDSAIFSLYAEMLSRCEQMDARLAKALASAELRESKLFDQLTEYSDKTRNIIHDEIIALNRDSYWHSLITSKVVGAIIMTVCVMVFSYTITKTILQSELAPLQDVINEHREAIKKISNDPESLIAYARYSKEANDEALNTAVSIHAISKLMALPKIQTYRSDDGFLTISGPESFMPIGTTKDGRNWVKLANPAMIIAPDTTPSINKANEAEKKLKQSK